MHLPGNGECYLVLLVFTLHSSLLGEVAKFVLRFLFRLLSFFVFVFSPPARFPCVLLTSSRTSTAFFASSFFFCFSSLWFSSFGWLAFFFGRIRHQKIFQCRSCAWESKECERRGGSRVCVYTLCMLCVWCSLENTFCRCFIEWKLPITISRESCGSNCLLSGQATSPQFSLDCCKIFT